MIDMEINFDELRRDLEGECLAMAFSGLGAAILDAGEVRRASDEELIEIAKRQGINLDKYRL